MYRQKNFFDKWKNKSGSQPSPRGRVTFKSMRLGSAGNIYKAGPRYNVKPSPVTHLTPPYRSGGRYESIPMRDVHDSPVASLRFPQHERRLLDSTPASPDVNHLNIDRKSLRKSRSACSSPRLSARQDNSCQTDDDLLDLCTNLRHRKPIGTTSSNSSGKSRTSAKKPRGGAAGVPGGGSVYYRSPPGVAPISVDDDDEATHEQLHCAQVTDRHPLLHKDEIGYDSSSDVDSYCNPAEETLQDGGQDYFYDSFIDSGGPSALVGPMLATATAGNDPITPTPARRVTPYTPTSTPGQSRACRVAPSTPVVGRGVVPRPSSTGLVISNMFANPKPRTDAAAAAASAKRDQTPQTPRRFDPSSNSLSGDSESKHGSREDMSQNDMKGLEEEEHSVAQFHDYLESKGVKLDLSNVQSSEV